MRTRTSSTTASRRLRRASSSSAVSALYRSLKSPFKRSASALTIASYSCAVVEAVPLNQDLK